jgi:hypothetical protein
LKKDFTRQEVLKLAGISSSNLSYMDRIELVVPRKEGNPRKPSVWYTEEQLVHVLIASRLSKDWPLQAIRIALNELKKRGYTPDLFDKRLLIINGDTLWIDAEASLDGVFAKLAKHKGQVILYSIGPIGDVYREAVGS